jgi:hypothetical protein
MNTRDQPDLAGSQTNLAGSRTRWAGASISRWMADLRQAVARTLLARVLDAATLGAVVAFHRLIGAKFLYGRVGFDEHYFLWEGFSTVKGMVPYRDFQEFKPPMIFIVNALAIKFFGLEAMGYRHFFSLLSLGAFLSLTIALLSRRTNRFLVIAVVALMIDHFFDGSLHDAQIDNAETAGLDFFMIGSGVLLLKTRYERLQQVAGAACLALAPLSKEPLAFATLAAWLALLLLHHYESLDPKSWRRFVLFTVAGVMGVLATWLGYMIVTRSLGWYIVQLKLNIAYTRNYAYQLGWFPRTAGKAEATESWRRLRNTYLNAAHLGVFVPLVVASLTLWGKRAFVGLAAALCACGALYAVTIGHAFAPHYFIMAMSGTFFWVVIGTIALDQYAKRAGFAMRRWVAASWSALAFVVLWPRASDEMDLFATYKPLEPPVSQPQVAFVRSHSSPGDKIFTLGEPLLYVFSDRLSAVREPAVVDELIEYNPGKTDEERLAGERDELAHNLPKLVVFGDDPVPGYGRKQRMIRSLVTPFLHDFGYKQIDDKVYERP